MMHLLYPRKCNSVRKGPSTATRPQRVLSTVCGHGSARDELAPLLGAAGLPESPFTLREQRGAALLLPAAKPCLRARRTGQHSAALHRTVAARRRVAGLPLVLHGYRDADF